MTTRAMIPNTFTQRGGPVVASRSGSTSGPSGESGVRDIPSQYHHPVYFRTLRILKWVPKLWDETVEAHRRAVRDATLDATAALVAEHGLASVTMSQIAERTGIGRATLYKYFSDVEAVLVAWHERQVGGHLRQLAQVGEGPGGAGQRLRAVLEAYALTSQEHHGSDLAAVLHRGTHVGQAQDQLSHFIGDLLREAAATGEVRDDVPPDELASYCLHALTAAGSLLSKAAARRLVSVVLAGLRPGVA